MRTRIHFIALALLFSGCGSDDNYVVSSSGGLIISPVRSALHAQMSFKDTTGTPHPQWVIVLTDAGDVCAKLATQNDYFLNPTESFNTLVLYVPPGNIGTYFIGQDNGMGSVAGNEALGAHVQVDGGPPQFARLGQVIGGGTSISLTQFNAAAGGQAMGSFDVGVSGSGGVIELIGKFKTNYCVAMANAQLP